MFDLHRHDEFSTFDGYGNANELARLAVELGYKALGSTNHGNTNGLVRTYQACKEVGIKAILGVEGYFLPKYKEKERGYHLIIVAKNLKGYSNMNKLQFEGEKQKYYNPIWTFEMLEKYHEGLICCTACVAGYLAQCILNGQIDKARKFLLKLKSIFGDDAYVEIQPYRVSENGMQEKVNVEAIKLANEIGMKCILTSDSHRGRKEDFDTYMKMHEVAGHNFADIKATYEERYMPKLDEMQKRFYKMHKLDFGEKEAKRMAIEFANNVTEIEDKCEENYLDELQLCLPSSGSKEKSFAEIKAKVKQGLSKRNKWTKEYINRCKEELEVIEYHGFEDYFLIVADYVNWAKNNGIFVGPGRGSVCNCLVAYALGITDVDSLFFNLDFRRFLRKDKKKFPDIDLDFETSRRQEVIQYLCKKYEGHSARICSYGLYKVDNLVNDLAKACGLETTGDIDETTKNLNKQEIARIKSAVSRCINEDKFDFDAFERDYEAKELNKKYDNIIIHFSKLFKKVRYIGTHAAGVAITSGSLLDYTALRIDKEGNVFTSYDLSDLEEVKVLKFDILGLKTMESIGELRNSTGVKVNYDEIVNDKEIMENFRRGNCDGVFQFEKKTARDMLANIDCDCFEDVVAASAMNRPGPLSMHMPETYAENKKNVEEAKESKYWEYTKETYGTIVYQEQLQQICVNLAGMSWADADGVMKMLKGSGLTEKAIKERRAHEADLRGKFVDGCMKKGFSHDEADSLFDKMIVYSFNRGHAVGYTLISVEEMFYKLHYPNEYWFCKLKYAKDESEYHKFCCNASKDGAVIFLPHVNYSTSKTRLRKVEGENCLQQGLSEIKNVGEKAADFIVEERNKNGIFRNFDEFYDRCKSRTVTSRVIDTLRDCGALEFDKKRYINRVIKYNSTLIAK